MTDGEPHATAQSRGSRSRTLGTGCAVRRAVKTRPRQAPRGPTDASIRMLPERGADGAFAGGGVGLLRTSSAASVETDSVGRPARAYRRGRAINHVIPLHEMRNL